MRKVILLALALSASAFCGGNQSPWGYISQLSVVDGCGANAGSSLLAISIAGGNSGAQYGVPSNDPLYASTLSLTSQALIAHHPGSIGSNTSADGGSTPGTFNFSYRSLGTCYTGGFYQVDNFAVQ